MEKKSLSYFLVVLVDSQNADFSLCPKSVIELTEQETNILIGKFSLLLYERFSLSNIPLKKTPTHYSTYIYEDGHFVMLNPLHTVNSCLDTQMKTEHIIFSWLPSSCLVEIKYQFEKEKLEKEHQSIISQLQVDLTSTYEFEKTFGKFLKDIMDEAAIKLPEPKKLTANQNLEINKILDMIWLLKQKHDMLSEADQSLLVTECLELALQFVNTNIKVQQELLIAPKFKYYVPKIERLADCAIYFKNQEHVICLVQTKGKDFEEILRRSADQLRAYCICTDKDRTRGIATNGIEWRFTHYKRERDEEFSVSQRFEIGTIKNQRFGFLNNAAEIIGMITAFLDECFEM